MEGGKARVQCRQPAMAPARQFSEPGIRNLRASLQMTMRDTEKIQRIAPPYVSRVGGYLTQRLPRRYRAGVDGSFHMHAQQRSLCEDARGESVSPVQCGKPMMDAVVVDMRIQAKRHEYIPIEQPRQASSSSASI